MPDISMCTGGDCPMKDKCYRFTATPDEHRQAYFQTPPFKKELVEAVTVETWPIILIPATDIVTCDYFSAERK